MQKRMIGRPLNSIVLRSCKNSFKKFLQNYLLKKLIKYKYTYTHIFFNFFLLDTMSVDDTDIESTILKCSQENNGYLVCPHTATAVKYFYEMEW